jgi:hypothetical protein
MPARSILLLASVIALLFRPDAGAAQACLGLPGMPGQLTLGGSFEVTTQFRGYGANVRAFPAPFIAGVSYRLDDFTTIESYGHTGAVLLGVELPLPTTSICVLAEPSYSILQYDYRDPRRPATAPTIPSDARTLRAPLMIGVGQRLDVGDWYVVPSARAGLLYLHVREEAENALDIDTTGTEVTIGPHVAVGSGPGFLTLGFQVQSGEGTRPTFIVGAGFNFP